MSDLARQKKALRDLLLSERNALSLDFCEQASRRIAAHLNTYIAQYTWRNILLFNSIGKEPKLQYLTDILAKNIILGFPRVNSSHKKLTFHRICPETKLVKSSFGIMEPPTSAPVLEPDGGETTLIIVPGLGFDHEGFRIGYGGGFYDRYLSQYGHLAQTVGVSYHQFLREQLPHNDLDQPVALCVTERGITYFR